MISEGYVRAGAKVYISSRDAKSCDEACKELNALGPGTATSIPADLYKAEDCKRLAEELGKREKGIYAPFAVISAFSVAINRASALAHPYDAPFCLLIFFPL